MLAQQVTHSGGKLEAMGFRRVPGQKRFYVKMMDTELTVSDGLGREKNYDYPEELLPSDRFVYEETGAIRAESEDFLDWQDAEAVALAENPRFLWRE